MVSQMRVFSSLTARDLLRNFMGSPAMVTGSLTVLSFLGVQGLLPYTITRFREIALKSRAIA